MVAFFHNYDLGSSSDNNSNLPEKRRMPFTKIRSIVCSISLIGVIAFILSSSSSFQQAKRGSSLEMPYRVLSKSRKLLEQDTANNYDRTEPFPLFDVSTYTVMGPSHFPKPTRVAELRSITKNDSGESSSTTKGAEAAAGIPRPVHQKNIQPIMKPTHGSHRPNVDAVFIFASEYPLHNYMCFLETLRKTGFDGDVVMAVSKQDVDPKGNANVYDYLTNEPNTVIYVVELSCFNAEGEAVSSAKGGMRVCQIHDMFGEKEEGNGGGEHFNPLQDPRPPRTVQTTRYELYWTWSLQYNTNSWIMLVDARDSYFQSNPFETVPRDHGQNTKTQGILHFFGENTDATRIGLSKKNKQWITTAYGNVVSTAMEKKPTICSGSTMGEQIAIETYLRAMVAESDESGVVLVGADQGFHNFLYYSNKLANAATISKIVVFAQGEGAINNLGAMRTKELNEWGNGNLLLKTNDDMTVHNWDGSLSPVVHQFDRHKELSNYMYKRKAAEFRQEWQSEKAQRSSAK